MEYILSETIAEALQALKNSKGMGRIIAGGTDVLLDIEDGKYTAEFLIDITRIPELLDISLEDSLLIIGAAVTFTGIARSALVKQYAPSLAIAAGRVGSPQIANAATLAGNVITAQPAADGAMALAALDPVFIIEGPDGRRSVSIDEMYAGFGRSTVDSTKEIVTHIKIPCQKEDEASAFVRLDMRKSLALPMLNTSARAKVKNGKFEWVKIAMGPVGAGPTRAKKAEEWLTQRDISKSNIQKAAHMVLEDANPRSSPFRGSREYRLKTLPVIVEQALVNIVEHLGLGDALCD